MPSFGHGLFGAQHAPPMHTPAPPEPAAHAALHVFELPEHALTGPVPLHCPAAQAAGFAQQAVPLPAGGFGLSRLNVPQLQTFVPRPQPRSKLG